MFLRSSVCKYEASMVVLMKNKIATVNVLYSLKFQRLFNFFKLKFIHIEPKRVCFCCIVSSPASMRYITKPWNCPLGLSFSYTALICIFQPCENKSVKNLYFWENRQLFILLAVPLTLWLTVIYHNINSHKKLVVSRRRLMIQPNYYYYHVLSGPVWSV